MGSSGRATPTGKGKSPRDFQTRLEGLKNRRAEAQPRDLSDSVRQRIDMSRGEGLSPPVGFTQAVDRFIEVSVEGEIAGKDLQRVKQQSNPRPTKLIWVGPKEIPRDLEARPKLKTSAIQLLGHFWEGVKTYFKGWAQRPAYPFIFMAFIGNGNSGNGNPIDKPLFILKLPPEIHTALVESGMKIVRELVSKSARHSLVEDYGFSPKEVGEIETALGTFLLKSAKDGDLIPPLINLPENAAQSLLHDTQFFIAKRRYPPGAAFNRAAKELGSDKGYENLIGGELNRAKGEFEKTLLQDPDNVDALNGLALIALQKRDTETAKRLVTRSLEINPNHAFGQFILGSVYRLEGNIPGAIKLTQRALKKSPDQLELRIQLGDLYASQGLFSFAEKEYQKALSIIPFPKVSHSELGSKDNQGNYTGLQWNLFYDQIDNLGEEIIQKVLLRALETDPDNANHHFQLGLSYGDYHSKEGAYKKAIEIDPDHAYAHWSLGNIYRMANHEDAERELRRAYQLDPKNQMFVDDLIGFYKAQENWVEFEFFRGESKKLEGVKNIHERLAKNYLQEGNLEKAKLEFKKILDIDPYHVNTLIELGKIYVYERKWEEAIAVLRIPRGRVYDFPESILPLAWAYEGKGDWQKAITESELYLKLHEGDPGFHFWLGELYLKIEELEKAKHYFKKVRDSDGMDDPALSWDVYNKLGDIYIMEDKFNKALDEYRSALQTVHQPNAVQLGDIYYKLGVVYFGLRREKHAIMKLEKALEYNPNDARAKKFLKKIKRKKSRR